MKSPVNDQEPRPFLGTPVNGWACSMCDFMTDLESMNKQHASIRHHATLKRDKIPPYQVRLQHVDGKFFRVKGKIIHEIDAIEEKLETAKEGLSTEKSAGVVGLLPSWLKYLPGVAPSSSPCRS